MDRSEQWKLEGKCSECRRQSYCKKTCSATKAAIQRGMVEAISQTKVGRLAMLIMQQTRGCGLWPENR